MRDMKSTIFKDDQAIRNKKKDADYAARRVEKVAELWNKQGNMGKMTAKDFALLLDRGARYFVDSFHEAIRRDEARAKGDAYYDLVDVTRYAPKPIDDDVNFDIAKLERIIDGMNLRPGNWSWVDFNKGRPYVPKKAYEDIENQHTIYASKKNMEALDAGEKAAEQIDDMIAKGYDIRVGRPFIKEGGRYIFDVRTLERGDGRKPVKAHPVALEVDDDPVEITDKVVSRYQPVSTKDHVRRTAI